MKILVSACLLAKNGVTVYGESHAELLMKQ